MNTNTTPRATCEHADASAAEAVPCLTPQVWYCEEVGGCGGEFTIVKPHHVVKFTMHALDCDRRHLPAGWCGCKSRKTAGCIDCDKEFPRDVEPSAEILIFD